MPPKRKRGDGNRDGNGDVDDDPEPSMKNAAQRVGFFDAGIPVQLYPLWRGQIHRAIQNWDCYGAGEAGTNKWSEFCEWAARQPSMAPQGQLTYNQDVIRRHVRMLYDDVAKKARNSRQSMWDTIQRARAAHRAANLGLPVTIEYRRWPLPAA